LKHNFCCAPQFVLIAGSLQNCWQPHFIHFTLRSRKFRKGESQWLNWRGGELHIRYISFLTTGYDHAGCKDFTVALKMYCVFNEKQMYDSVIKGKENASKDWNCIVW